MTTPSEKSGHEGAFSTFTVGVAFGVVAALLFGTEEGRKLVKRALDAIPDKYKTPPVRIPSSGPRTPIIPAEETSHHTTFDEPSLRGGTPTWQSHSTSDDQFDSSFGEAPPPPAPHVRPPRPEPFKPTL